MASDSLSIKWPRDEGATERRKMLRLNLEVCQVIHFFFPLRAYVVNEDFYRQTFCRWVYNEDIRKTPLALPLKSHRPCIRAGEAGGAVQSRCPGKYCSPSSKGPTLCFL